MADLAEGQSSPPPDEELPYEPRDAIANTFTTSLKTGVAGLFLATVQTTLARRSLGAFGVFSTFGGTTAWAAGAGATYAFVTTASANLKGQNDIWNNIYGGFATGALLGLRKRTFPAVFGTGLFGAGIFAAMFIARGQVFSAAAVEERRAYKEEHRRRFRRPYQEMVNEIGEGRGIYPPGYEERRKQRLLDNYGIEIREPYYERKRAAGIETSAL